MKTFSAFLILLATALSVIAQEEPAVKETIQTEEEVMEETASQSLKFKQVEHDFGQVTQGDVVEKAFIFENVSGEPADL